MSATAKLETTPPLDFFCSKEIIGDIRYCTYSEDGRFLCLAADKQTVVVDAETHQEIQSFQASNNSGGWNLPLSFCHQNFSKEEQQEEFYETLQEQEEEMQQQQQQQRMDSNESENNDETTNDNNNNNNQSSETRKIVLRKKRNKKKNEENPLFFVASSPSSRSTLSLFKYDEEQETFSLDDVPVCRGTSNFIYCVVSADNSEVAGASADSCIHVGLVDSKKERLRIVHECQCMSVAYSYSSDFSNYQSDMTTTTSSSTSSSTTMISRKPKFFVITDYHGKVVLASCGGGEILYSLKGHNDRPRCVTFLHNSPTDFVTSSVDEHVKVWRIIDKKETTTTNMSLENVDSSSASSTVKSQFVLLQDINAAAYCTSHCVSFCNKIVSVSTTKGVVKMFKLNLECSSTDLIPVDDAQQQQTKKLRNEETVPLAIIKQESSSSSWIHTVALDSVRPIIAVCYGPGKIAFYSSPVPELRWKNRRTVFLISELSKSKLWQECLSIWRLKYIISFLVY